MCEQDKMLILKLLFSTACAEESIENFNFDGVEVDWINIYKLLKVHDLTHLLAYALQEKGLLNQNVPIKKQLSQDMLLAIYRYESHYYEQERIKECLNKINIPFIFLKGAVMREYYKEPWLRTSCDIDILVPADQLSQAATIVAETLGYRVEYNAAHEVSLFAESKVHLEIHASVVGDSEEQALLSQIWSTAYTKADSEHFMSNELFYVYHIVHMAKHLKNGGCGIRSFIDLQILLTKFQYDRNMVDAMLLRWTLKQFEEKAIALGQQWLTGEKDEKLTIMERYVLYGGSYGVLEQSLAVKRGEATVKKYVLRRIFVPYGELKTRYKILEKHKILTPFFAVVRWISLLNPRRRKRAMREVKGLQSFDDKQRAEISEMLIDLGLR